MATEYRPGQALCLRFGGEWGNDQAILCLFGDQEVPGSGWAMDAAMAEHPRQANLSDRQMVSFCFRFDGLRPYREMKAKMEVVAELAKTEWGWDWADAIEDLPDTGSQILDLADTDEPPFWGTAAQDFPRTPNVGGYNAAQGFLLLLEKTGTRPYFSDEEISNIRLQFEKLMVFIYGSLLPEVQS